MTEEAKDLDLGTCEICEKQFEKWELEADDWYGPPTCEVCREWAKLNEDHYRETDNWLNRNR